MIIDVDNLQDFLLLDESDRDNRLLSTSTADLPVTEQNSTANKPTRRKSLSIVCELNNARWEQVCRTHHQS